jgi:hypothetical protein
MGAWRRILRADPQTGIWYSYTKDAGGNAGMHLLRKHG